MSESVSSHSRCGSSTTLRGIDSIVDNLDVSATRKYPSVKDYYIASSHKDKPIQLQSGLTNFSGLQLGDDRIQFTESVMAVTFASEKKTRTLSPSKQQSYYVRQREYEQARQVVTESDLDHLERVMKNKLQQRSEHVSSPFQIRKAMKFFDADRSGFISLEDFAHALEFLGFQFTDVQNKALFARYDTDCSGGIDYMTFINQAMFDQTISHKPGVEEARREVQRIKGESIPGTPKNPINNERPDFDDEELRAMQEAELKRIFTLVNRQNPSDCVSKSEFELLLLTLLGFELSAHAVEGCIGELNVLAKKSGVRLGTNAKDISIPFNLFLSWWTTSNSPFLQNRSNSNRK